MPTDGRITSLGTVASLSSTDLVMVVSPGNASSGINYQATVQQIASYVAGTTAAGSDTQVQYNNGGVLGGSPALTWVGPNLRVGTVGTVGGLQVVGQTAGGVIFNAVASSAVWTFTLPPSAGTANLPLVTDGLGTTAWTTLRPPGGGTGLTAYSTGDLLYASNATTLARLAAATANYILTSNATNLAPSWSSSILVLGSLTTNTSVVVIFKGSSDTFNTILGGGSGNDSYIRGNTATSRIIIGDQNSGDVLLSSASGRVVVQATASAVSNSTAALVVAGGLAVASTFFMGGPLVASQNATALPAAVGTADYRFAAADAVQTRILIDAFGSGPQLAFRRANGTAGGPSAITVSQGIGQFAVYGYGATGYSGQRGQCLFTAAETWTDSAQGTIFAVTLTPTGTTVLSGTPSIVGYGSGGLSIGLSAGTANDPGSGLIYTNSTSFMIRSKATYNNGASTHTATLTNAPASTNPTKWIPVDDNGTTRYIPAW